MDGSQFTSARARAHLVKTRTWAMITFKDGVSEVGASAFLERVVGQSNFGSYKSQFTFPKGRSAKRDR